ncbi:MAG: hypothetical protein ACREXG_08785, partial [Polaromonas sp.]
LYPEWLDFIELEETKAAFVYIVGLAACARSLSCHPQLKGENGPVRDFRFFDMEGKQYFSFITNRKPGDSVGPLFLRSSQGRISRCKRSAERRMDSAVAKRFRCAAPVVHA